MEKTSDTTKNSFANKAATYVGIPVLGFFAGAGFMMLLSDLYDAIF